MWIKENKFSLAGPNEIVNFSHETFFQTKVPKRGSTKILPASRIVAAYYSASFLRKALRVTWFPLGEPVQLFESENAPEHGNSIKYCVALFFIKYVFFINSFFQMLNVDFPSYGFSKTRNPYYL